MNAFLWVLQIALGGLFGFSGALKASWPKGRLIESGQTGVVFFPEWAIRVIASLEILAVLGLLGPAVIDRWTVLTPMAATGICLLMVGAAVTHIQLKEPKNVVINTVVFILAAVVAASRF